MKNKREKFVQIKQFLIKNANAIQKEATVQHKRYLKTDGLRIEYIDKYQKNHVQVVKQVAYNLEKNSIKKGAAVFRELGETLANDSVSDGLTLEEAIDGTIFLKQAIWKRIKKEGLLTYLSSDDVYEFSRVIGTYIDVLASKIAFTFHKQTKYIESNLRFLAEASRLLSSSLDYQTTLNTIASLAVPEIGDWCSVELLDEQGKISQVAVAHKDPKKVKWAKELRKKSPPKELPRVMQTGKSELYPTITDDMLVAMTKTKKDLKLARSIGFTSAISVPLFSQGKPIGAINFITTVTRRHYNKSDLVMAEELGTRASVAIENARLYKGSQDAIALRDDFISVASHELKTPVTSVKMFTQVLKHHSEQIGDLKAVDHLLKMDKQLNKLTELIYNLLNISKIQAGRMEFNYAKFDFDKSVREVVDVLQQNSKKHKLEIQGKTGKRVCGDEDRIGQVLSNLISNAIKYSPRASKIVITLASKVKMVHVAVQDFGIGMANQHLERIFERFYRVYDTTDKTFPGLGIGLYISSEIVKRHGGKFWVESDIGKGSVFHFSLPVNIPSKKTKK